MASLAATKKEWNACLAKSGGAPGRCEKIEKELRGKAQSAGANVCIDETVSLMRCTGGSGKSAGCGAQFMAMRECNRAGGAQLVKEMGAFAVAPGKASLFESSAGSLLTSVAPARTLQGMQDAGIEYAQSLGIMQGEVRF